jgi:hypothetical protein
VRRRQVFAAAILLPGRRFLYREWLVAMDSSVRWTDQFSAHTYAKQAERAVLAFTGQKNEDGEIARFDHAICHS